MLRFKLALTVLSACVVLGGVQPAFANCDPTNLRVFKDRLKRCIKPSIPVTCGFTSFDMRQQPGPVCCAYEKPGLSWRCGGGGGQDSLLKCPKVASHALIRLAPGGIVLTCMAPPKNPLARKPDADTVERTPEQSAGQPPPSPASARKANPDANER